MPFGGFDRAGRAHPPMGEINVTPLVDVMLVLLVIFLVAAPLLTVAVQLELPREAAAPVAPRVEPVRVSVDAAGRIYWNDEPVGAAQLRGRLADAAARVPQPELHLRADRATRYEPLAEVLAAAQAAGLARVGFVMNPPEAAVATSP